MSNEPGVRYYCANCNSEFLVTKGGKGSVVCCGQLMIKK